MTGFFAASSVLAWGALYVPPPIPIKIEHIEARTPAISDELPKETTLLFGGDLMLSRGIGNIMQKRRDFVYPFYQVKKLMEGADLAIVNLEGPISSRGKNVGSIYSFRADPRAIEGLTFAGIDLVSLANNHSGDYGPDALSETLELLRTAGVRAVGAGINMTEAQAPVFFEINGLKIAFLGATPLAPTWLTRTTSTPAVAPLDEKAIIEQIVSARTQGADIVGILLHFGNEYATKHSLSQEQTTHRLIDAGATMVIGHHPHVVQEVEHYHGGVIAYSLGNFVFDQNFSEDTHHGLLLKVTLRGKNIDTIQEIPVYFSKDYQPFLEKIATTTSSIVI